jgi:hypothetical protein
MYVFVGFTRCRFALDLFHSLNTIIIILILYFYSNLQVREHLRLSVGETGRFRQGQRRCLRFRLPL